MFVKYPKIPTGTKGLPALNDEQAGSLDSVEWAVTEKIHGANFCFMCDGHIVECAKRSRQLEAQDDFFGHALIYDALKERVLAAHKITAEKYADIAQVCIYGEIFGGKYDHPSSPQVEQVAPVQTEIQYCPTTEFLAFDLGIMKETAHCCLFLGYSEAIEIFTAAGIPYVRPLLIGSLDDALNYPLEYESTIPGLFGLPKLQFSNPAEGIVVKSLDTLSWTRKDGTQYRPCFKVKAPQFSEDRRNEGSTLNVHNHGNSSDLEILKWEVFNLATDNRVVAWLSKIGFKKSGQKSESRNLFHSLVREILDHVEDNQGELVAQLGVVGKRNLLTYTKGVVRNLLKEYFSQEQRRV